MIADLMAQNSSQNQFFELVRVGLWAGYSPRGLAHGSSVDWDDIYRLAEEQSVVGLVAAGIDSLPAFDRPSQDVTLQIIGEALKVEQQNLAMNSYINSLMMCLKKEGIHAVLLKGQGVAQCYEKPLWRCSGDVDLYLSDVNYYAAKKKLSSLASQVDNEDEKRLHFAMTIDGWTVELHGTLHSNISSKVNQVLDDIHENIFCGGEVRKWENAGVAVFLPSANNDVVIVFAHILQHFFVEGIGLRQICDWCRLLWTYRESLDLRLLEKRIRQMKMMTEWKAFGALAVEYLGMPKEAMPFYDLSYKVKGDQIVSLILDTGTFGHNRDLSYKQSDPFVKRLVRSFKRRNGDSLRLITIFPLDGMRMWWKMIVLGVSVAVRGK